MTSRRQVLAPERVRFRHEVLLYEGDDGFIEYTVPFVRDGVAAEEPILVAVSAERIDLLRDALGRDAAHVTFADMGPLGRNPARILPRWRGFLAEHGDAGAIRGVGEPVWAARPAQELDECQRHEELLNLAFADANGFRLVCPYDVSALPADVIDEALRAHPLVLRDGATEVSERWGEPARWSDVFDPPLPDPVVEATELALDATNLSRVRRIAGETAELHGMPEQRVEDLVLALGEVAANTLRHGGGSGTVRLWREDATLVCEVRDKGTIDAPLVGRIAPGSGQDGGVGLWLVNQLCDLVQIRSNGAGTTVRLYMSLR